jgi:starch phosphorylase
LEPDAVQVELYSDVGGSGKSDTLPMTMETSLAGAVHGYRYVVNLPAGRAATDYTVRVVPRHPQVRIPQELPLIHWQH